jgi:hypothetical protein
MCSVNGLYPCVSASSPKSSLRIFALGAHKPLVLTREDLRAALTGAGVEGCGSIPEDGERITL